ncbi:MAG: TSUP family transporter [Aureliella sp.]
MIALEPQFVATVLILAGSACLQATVGFAAGLMGIPLLLWAGNTLPEAQVLIITAMLPQNALLVWKLRQHLDPWEIAVPAAVRLSFMPVGLLALAWLVGNWSMAIQPLVGTMVLSAVATQLVRGRPWLTAGRWYWVLGTFGLSGVLQGLSGMSAPPMLLWVHGQRFSPNRARSFLFAMYLTNFVPQLALMFWTFGPTLLTSVLLALSALPLIMLGSLIGLRLGNRLGEKWLRPVTYGLLVWTAVACLLDSWLS